MNKQKSIKKILRQQLSQLDKLGNEQLNELLERLESQKAKLPLEDHPIIDWGIGVIRARALEEEEFKKKMCKELEAKYHSYSIFEDKAGWKELDLNRDKDQNEWRKSITNHLEEIVAATGSCNSPERAEKYARTFKDYLSTFCCAPEVLIPPEKVVKGCTDFCERRIAKLDNPQDINYDKKHAACYKSLLKGLT